MATPVPGGFGLYLHWPFCQSKCPYCDFNSHVSATINHDHWRVAYLSEIDRAGRETAGRLLETVYFGGGTPSLMDPDVVGAILDRIRATWPMVNDPEITLEANPSSVEAGRFRAYAAAGVNRVSMGIQALNDEDLKRLGRLHTAREARVAFDVAAGVFGRTSLDLIYARQDQTLAIWADELSAALDWAGDHLSLYQLTIEPGTAFGDRHAKGGLKGLPGEDLSADMYMKTNDICEAAGLHAYEVSNYARPGAESRHNLIYWRGGDYVGIGPGAHGRLTLDGGRHATETPLKPQVWLNAVLKNGSGEASRAALTQQEWGQEYLMMGLRTAEGVNISRHREVTGAALDPDAVSELTGLGLLDLTGDSLCATSDGRLVLNAVLRRLMRGD
ncbi:MAG: radical SAM family heme chaperone HemW [Pseudomonadota bacterium]